MERGFRAKRQRPKRGNCFLENAFTRLVYLELFGLRFRRKMQFQFEELFFDREFGRRLQPDAYADSDAYSYAYDGRNRNCRRGHADAFARAFPVASSDRGGCLE